MEYLNKVGTNLNIYHDFSVDEEAVELVLDAVGVGVLVMVLLRENHVLLHAVSYCKKVFIILYIFQHSFIIGLELTCLSKRVYVNDLTTTFVKFEFPMYMMYMMG